LLFDEAEGPAGKEEARVRAGDAMDDCGDAYVGLRLPGDGVGRVGAEIVEDAGGWSGDGLVEVARGGEGCALLVVEDDEGSRLRSRST